MCARGKNETSETLHEYDDPWIPHKGMMAGGRKGLRPCKCGRQLGMEFCEDCIHMSPDWQEAASSADDLAHF